MVYYPPQSETYMNTDYVVTGLFETAEAAAATVEDMINNGFGREDISVAMTDETRGKGLGITEHTKAAEGVAAGGVVGGLAGAVLAGMMGAGTIAAGGLNLVIAGPFLGMLAGLGAGSAVGGFFGALIGLGIPEHEVDLYREKLESGHVLVAIETNSPDDTARARDFFSKHKAINVSERPLPHSMSEEVGNALTS